MLVSFVSLQVLTLDLMTDHRPPEIYLRYITKVSRQAPHLESFTITYGHAFRFKRVNENWVVCGEDEEPAP
jgi:hypothetical protein